MELPLKFESETKAKALAIELSRTNPYVEVIESNGEYFVDIEPTMVRTWESVSVIYEDGKLQEEE